MKIESSQLQLAATHAAREHTSVQVVLDSPARPAPTSSTVVQLSKREAVLATDLSSLPVTTTSSPASEPVEDDEKLKADLRYQLVKSLFEQITGTRFAESDFELKFELDSGSVPVATAPASAEPAQAPSAPQIRQTRTETHTETEQTNFKAKGSVLTADGRKIDFAVDLTLQRSFSQQNTRQLVNGKPIDPLVINLDGQQLALSEGSVSFDLNGDGQTEQVHFVNQGSAFLALDKNADGQINNGTELFGPQSGDGFQDLAAYDEDQNQFIDENDTVFSQLRLYNKDGDGVDQLTTLLERGIGAISLHNTATPFALKDQQNQLQGQVRSSGVFLYENGKVGTVHQVDLVV